MPNEEMQPDFAEMSQSILESYDIPGKHTVLICPECGGTLWEIRRDNLISFRCHVGHAFSVESFLEEQAEEIELNLWKTLRTLKDRAKIFRQLAAEHFQQDDAAVAQQLEMQAKDALQRAELLRQILRMGEPKFDPESIALAKTSDLD
jgi:two-component system, chemotaxis family, protein-glutamate methylesterase/glutaminase